MLRKNATLISSLTLLGDKASHIKSPRALRKEHTLNKCLKQKASLGDVLQVHSDFLLLQGKVSLGPVNK